MGIRRANNIVQLLYNVLLTDLFNNRNLGYKNRFLGIFDFPQFMYTKQEKNANLSLRVRFIGYKHYICGVNCTIYLKSYENKRNAIKINGTPSSTNVGEISRRVSHDKLGI